MTFQHNIVNDVINSNISSPTFPFRVNFDQFVPVRTNGIVYRFSCTLVFNFSIFFQKIKVIYDKATFKNVLFVFYTLRR